MTVGVGSAAIAGCIATDDTSSNDGGSSDDQNDVGDDDPTEQEQPSGTRWYDPDSEIGVMDGVEVEIDTIGSMYLRGTAKNFSDTDYDYVQLEFEVYDETDAKIADGLANTSGLAAGQRWKFEALAPGADEADSYALTEITAF